MKLKGLSPKVTLKKSMQHLLLKISNDQIYNMIKYFSIVWNDILKILNR